MLRRHLTAAIVCATRSEYAHLKTLLGTNEETTLKGRAISRRRDDPLALALINGRPGKIHCASATQLAIDELHPDVVIDAGAAGSLSPDVRVGDIICATRCYEHDICPLEQFSRLADDLTTATLLADMNLTGVRAVTIHSLMSFLADSTPPIYLYWGNIVSGERDICDCATRDRLRDAFDALACNWESSAILKTAALSGVPSLSFRAITDLADERMSGDYRANREMALQHLGRALDTFLRGGWLHALLAAE